MGGTWARRRKTNWKLWKLSWMWVIKVYSHGFVSLGRNDYFLSINMFVRLFPVQRYDCY